MAMSVRGALSPEPEVGFIWAVPAAKEQEEQLSLCPSLAFSQWCLCRLGEGLVSLFEGTDGTCQEMAPPGHVSSSLTIPSPGWFCWECSGRFAKS